MQNTPYQASAATASNVAPPDYRFSSLVRILRSVLLVVGVFASISATYIFYFRPFFGIDLGLDSWLDERRCLIDALCDGPLYFIHHLGLILVIVAVLLFAFGFSISKALPSHLALSQWKLPSFTKNLQGIRLLGALLGSLTILIGLLQAYQLLIAKTQPSGILWLAGIATALVAGVCWDWSDDSQQAKNTSTGLFIGVMICLVLVGVVTSFARPLLGIGILTLGIVGFAVGVVFKRRARSILAPIDYLSMLLLSLAAFALGMLRINSWHYAFIGDEWTFYETARVLIDHPEVHKLFSTWDSLGYHSVLSLQFQAFVMRLAGTDVIGWKISSLMAVVLSIPALYIFLQWLGGRGAAFVGAGLFAASHLLLSFSMVAYNNTQALVPLAWGLGFFALAERRPSILRYILLGIVLGLSFYAFSLARLAVIPVGILFLLCFSGNRWRLIERIIPFGLGGLITAIPMLLNLDNWRSLLKATPVEHEVAHQTSEVLLSIASNVLASMQSFLYSQHNTHFVFGSHTDPLTAILLLIGLGYVIRFAGQQRKIGAWLVASSLFWAAVGGIQQYEFVSTTRMFILVVVYAIYAGIGAAALVRHILPNNQYLRGIFLFAIVVAGIFINQNHIVKISLAQSYWEDNDLLVKQLQDSAATDGSGIPVYIVWSSPIPRLENMILNAFDIDRSRIRFLSPEEFLTLPGFCESGHRATMSLLFAPQQRIDELRTHALECWAGATEVQVWNNVDEIRILQFTTRSGTEQLRLAPEQRLSWKSTPGSIPVSTGTDVSVDSNNQMYLFLRDKDEVLRYNLPDQRPTRIELIQDHPQGFTVAPDGLLVVSSESSSKKLVWYDARTGDVVRRVQGDYGSVNKGIAIAKNGEIYLTDFHGSQIWRLQPNGDVIRSYTGGGRITEPISIAIGADQSIWVLNIHGGGLLHISSDDEILHSFPFSHANPESAPRIVANDDGSVFVATPERQRIELYSADGRLYDVWGGFRWPTGLSVGPDGRFYVVDNELRELSIVAGISGQ